MIEVTFIDNMGNDDTVANAARVSFAKKARHYSPSQNERLINYLGKHKHISPFGHCFATFHVRAPVFVARQLVKHKFLRWNEISRRYVDEEPEFYVPTNWRGRSTDKKQGSEGVVKDIDQYTVKDTLEQVKDLYNQLIDVGCAPEMARMILPQNMITEWYWSGSLDAFADMCNLRCKEDTQYESQLVAYAIDCKMRRLYPTSWNALRE